MRRRIQGAQRLAKVCDTRRQTADRREALKHRPETWRAVRRGAVPIAVLYRYRTGMPWRDLPERFGDGTRVYLRQPLGQKRCVGGCFGISTAVADNEYAMIDSIIVRALQHSADAQKMPT